MEENEYSFRVSISESNSYESYNLKVKVNELSLCDTVTDELILEWPYTQIRRFCKTDFGVTIEAGRASEYGEGKYVFDTPEPTIIFSRMMSAIKRNEQRMIKEQAPMAEEVSPLTSNDDEDYSEPYEWVQPLKEKKVQRSQTYSPHGSPVIPHSRKQRSHTYTNHVSSRRREDKETVLVGEGCVRISDKDKCRPGREERYTPMPPRSQRQDEGHSYSMLTQTSTTGSDSSYITPVLHSSRR